MTQMISPAWTQKLSKSLTFMPGDLGVVSLFPNCDVVGIGFPMTTNRYSPPNYNGPDSADAACATTMCHATTMCIDDHRLHMLCEFILLGLQTIQSMANTDSRTCAASSCTTGPQKRMDWSHPASAPRTRHRRKYLKKSPGFSYRCKHLVPV